jgi:hypothetical protein
MNYTASAIAEIVGKTPRAIEIRAKKEGWPFVEENGKGRGGKTKKFPLASLPRTSRKPAGLLKGGPPAHLWASRPGRPGSCRRI